MLLSSLLLLCAAPVLVATQLPVGTHLEIRMRQGLHSYSAKAGTPIEAVVIAPVLVGGATVIPPGAIVRGQVREVTKVGLGLIHERASMLLEFNSLELPGGETIAMEASIFQIENAREKLDKRGAIRGIRSTNTPGFRAAGVLTSLAAVDPIALLFSTAAFTTMLRFSEPEIKWEVGAELILKLQKAIESDYRSEAGLQPVANEDSARRELLALVQRLPYRTETLNSGRASDLTNLVFVGNREALERAFEAAGWVQSLDSTASTKYRTVRAFAESQPFQEAPMSELLLDGESAVMTLSKTLNTFSRRHHIRIYEWKETWDGQSVFTASATHDTNIVVALHERKVTHQIDERIDEERAKVVNDLVFSGCVQGAEKISRPWVNGDAKNGTGQLLATDRAIAVLRINDCQNPRRFNEGNAVEAGPFRGNALERSTRQSILRLRNDLLRGNLVWQTTSWALQLRRMMQAKSAGISEQHVRQTWLPDFTGTSAAWRPETWTDAPEGSSMVALAKKRERPAPVEPTLGARADWERPTVELGFNFGTSLFCNSTVGNEALILTRHPTPDGIQMQFSLAAGNRISPGWALGGFVTVHANRWISNEIGFHYLRGNFRLGLLRLTPGGSEELPGRVEQSVGLLTRQFSYNTVAHLRPLESRWRPYLAAGPALQLVHLTDAPFKSAKGIFRLGLSNVGMLQSAYNFSSAPPLDGGGIFQPAIQVGGGLKFRVRKCWLLRLDYRSSISQRPDFLKKSLAPLVAEIVDAPRVQTRQWFPQQRLTAGFSFTF